MSFPLAVLAATAGNLLGSLLAYGLGASHLLEGLPGADGLLGRSRSLLDRYGPMRAVFVARLLPLARTFVSLPAGAQGVPLPQFVALTTLGCALWAVAFVLAGLLSPGRLLGGGRRHTRLAVAGAGPACRGSRRVERR